MVQPVVIRIVGAPIACKEGFQDRWRETAQWAARQLQARYGAAVQVEYFDLFDADCPPLPPDASLPVVFANDEVVSNGGKISIPAIRSCLEGMGIKPVPSDG